MSASSLPLRLSGLLFGLILCSAGLWRLHSNRTTPKATLVFQNYDGDHVIPPTSGSSRIAVFVRTTYSDVGINKDKVPRLSRWIKELSTITNPPIDIWISSRGAIWNEQLSARLRAQNLTDGSYHLFPFDNDQLQMAFAEATPRKQPGKLWKFVQQAVLLWWTQKNGSYEHVWVVQDDIDFCGDIASFLLKYEKLYPSADLVSKRMRLKGRDWNHKLHESPEFSQSFQANESYITQRFIQRYSNELMDLMYNKTQHGIFAFQDQFAASICMKSGCKYEELLDEDLGLEFQKPQPPLSPRRFRQLCAGEGGANRLHHSLRG